MKRIVTMVAAVSLFSLLGIPATLAQPCLEEGFPRGQSQRLYNQNRLETISGRVTGIERVVPTRSRSRVGGVHLQFRTNQGENILVRLGPAWYLDDENIAIKVGDKIEITGYKVDVSRESTIIATQIKTDNRTITLRDENGFPVWRGWRHRWQ